MPLQSRMTERVSGVSKMAPLAVIKQSPESKHTSRRCTEKHLSCPAHHVVQAQAKNNTGSIPSAKKAQTAKKRRRTKHQPTLGVAGATSGAHSEHLGAKQ